MDKYIFPDLGDEVDRDKFFDDQLPLFIKYYEKRLYGLKIFKKRLSKRKHDYVDYIVYLKCSIYSNNIRCIKDYIKYINEAKSDYDKLKKHYNDNLEGFTNLCYTCGLGWCHDECSFKRDIGTYYKKCPLGHETFTIDNYSLALCPICLKFIINETQFVDFLRFPKIVEVKDYDHYYFNKRKIVYNNIKYALEPHMSDINFIIHSKNKYYRKDILKFYYHFIEYINHINTLEENDTFDGKKYDDLISINKPFSSKYKIESLAFHNYYNIIYNTIKLEILYELITYFQESVDWNIFKW